MKLDKVRMSLIICIYNILYNICQSCRDDKIRA